MKRAWLSFAALAALLQLSTARAAQLPSAHGHQHDFDFEFGSWKARLRVRPPLSTSNKWADYQGTSVVKKIWNGRANYGELELTRGNAHLEGLTLRLFNPQAQQWDVYFSNSADGELGVPAIGGFNNGRGEFYDHESFHGKPVYVRFVFDDMTPTSFRFTQSYSADNGKTWIVNWNSTFTR